MTVDVLGVGATGPSSDRPDASPAPGADASVLALLFQDLIATEDTTFVGDPAAETAGTPPPDNSAGSTPGEASAHGSAPPYDWSTWSAARAFLFANVLAPPPAEDADVNLSPTGHHGTSNRTECADADLPAEDVEEEDDAVPVDLLLTGMPVQVLAQDLSLTLTPASNDAADRPDATAVAATVVDFDNSLENRPAPANAPAVDPALFVPASLSASEEGRDELSRGPGGATTDATIATTSESSSGATGPAPLVKPIVTSAMRPQATLAKGVLFELRPAPDGGPPAALQQSTPLADVPQGQQPPLAASLAQPSARQQAIAQAFAARPSVAAPSIVDRLSGLRGALPMAHLLGLSRTSSVGAVHDERVADVLPVNAIDAATLLATRTNHIVSAPSLLLPPDAAGPGLEASTLSAVLAHEDEIANSMVQAMRMQWRNGSGSAVVSLKPDYLGDVTIALHVNGGSVDATLHAANSDVRAWLQANEAGLRQGLAAQGLTLDRFQVTEDAAEKRDAQDGRRRPAPQAEPEPRRQPRRDDTHTFNVVV